MRNPRPRRNLLALMACTACAFAVQRGDAQTPEEARQWSLERSQAQATAQAKAEKQAREREARKGNPMAWVNTLDPMTAGGWEFRAVAADGAWAAYATRHQMKRMGSQVTVWLRQEYAEPQSGSNGVYSSAVEKMQYDCAKERARPLLVIYYASNNVQGSEQTEEADAKTAPWNPIVPGTRDELNFLWACKTGA